MTDPRFQEQIEYYRARAREVEETALPAGAFDTAEENPFAQEWRKALDLFLQRVRRAVKPKGDLFILDEPRGTKNILPIPTVGITQTRTLKDGRSFTIVKEYYDPDTLRSRMSQFGFQSVEMARGDYFFWMRATRAEHDQAN